MIPVPQGVRVQVPSFTPYVVEVKVGKIVLGKFGEIAQLVEQQTENLRVDGSIPSFVTQKVKGKELNVINNIYR